MSSPLSSLKKPPRVPFNAGSGQRGFPFRTPNYSDDESALLDEITTEMTKNTLALPNPMFSGLPRINSLECSSMSSSNSTPRGHDLHGRKQGPGPSDRQLLSMMMTRCSQMESKLAFQKRDVSDKDKAIRILKDKLKMVTRMKGGDAPDEKVFRLEQRCLVLQQQIYEMEAFLTDYGMTWVGDKVDKTSNVYLADDNSSEEDRVWRPDSSFSHLPEFSIDFDKLLENIVDLNILAGEGLAKVQRTKDGARLKIPDPVSLVFYSNGLMLFSGPFRPYEDPTTELFLSDLLDGYFPSELQQRYPDGIPFLVSDMRKVKFDNSRQTMFGGQGQTLGGDKLPSRLVPTNLNKATSCRERASYMTSTGLVTNQGPGVQLSIEEYLNKLPVNVVRQGQLFDIRNTIGKHLQPIVTPTPEIVVMTNCLSDNKETQKPDEKSITTTLRVKNETGEDTIVITLSSTSTVKDLRNCLDKQRKSNTSDYQITSAYPNKVYDDPTLTLEQCGLTPNAVLHLKRRS